MKILHILSSDDQYGSAKSFLELLDQEIFDSDIEPYVVVPKENRISKYCKDKGIKCLHINYEQVQIPKHDNAIKFAIKYILHFACYCKFNRKALKVIKKFAIKESIDVIHSNSSVINIGAKLHNETGIPHIWHLREYGKEDFNFYPMRINMIRYMNYSAECFICISKAMKDCWTKKGLEKNKTVVISHGVDASKFMIKKEFNSTGSIRGVMCGSFSIGKGQVVLLKALKELSALERTHIHIDFYGKAEGNYYEQFKKLINEYRLNDVVTVRGFSSDMNKELVNYDIGLMCSKAEAMGRVTIEYMMSGLCTVVSRAGANIEIIEENNCGFLYKTDDVKSLVSVIQTLMANRQLIKEYGERSMLVARTKYDVNINAKKIIQILKEYALKGTRK